MVEIDQVLRPPAQRRAEGGARERQSARHVVIVAWRDIASPQAGGSELLVDQLAAGLTARGDRVTLLCGGPSAPHSYDVVRSGGPYTQFLRAPSPTGGRSASAMSSWKSATACRSWRRYGPAGQ